MLFPEEDAPILKTWIVKRIEDTSDADSEVLAEYIIALLKHEGTKEEVRKLCEAEIPDFLTEDPAKFLDDVFRAIAYKSYVPGAPAPPSLTRAQNWYSTGQEQVGAQNGNQMAPTGREMAQSAQGATAEQFHPARQGNGMPPMSRKRGYRDLDAPLELSELSQNPRPTKNARRNGPEPAEHDPSLQYGQFPGFMQHLDLENPMAQQFRDMQMNMNMIMQSQWQNKGHGGHKKNKRQCRDFVTKGYCSRGASCNFEHGFDGGFLPNMGNVGEDYNPDNPSVILADSQAQFNPLPMQQPPFPQARGRGNKRTRGQRRKGGARASFSMEGPETDTSESTIVVKNIPEESFTEEEVRTFFSTFGSVTEVSLKPYKRLAIVKYDSWDAANAAYHSPKVVFDNRFVKVFWYRDESQILPPQHQAGGGAFRNGSHEAEPFDPEQFARKQEEAQKAYEEREAKRAEIDELKRELAEKQQDLLERHKAESSKLQSKLLSRNGSSTPDTNPLKAQLALLEQEAKMLGIDPDASPVDDDMSVSSWSTARGGWRGRSRGRGVRRTRGSFRGVGDRHAAYSRYSLDLRPRRVAISGVDFTESKKGELLRHFLLNISALDYSVDPTPSQTIVTLADRRTAEKLYTLLDGKQLPGIETDLQLEYLPNLPSSAPAKSDSTAPQLAGGGGGGGGEGGGEGSGLGGGNGPPWPGSGDGGEVGWGMVINPDEDSASEEGEIEDTDMGGKQQAEDDDAY